MTYLQINHPHYLEQTLLSESVYLHRPPLAKCLIERGCEPDLLCFSNRFCRITNVLYYIRSCNQSNVLDQIDMTTYFWRRNITFPCRNLLEYNYNYVNFYVIKALRESGCRMICSKYMKSLLKNEINSKKKAAITTVENYIKNPLSLQHEARIAIKTGKQNRAQ